MNKMQLWILTRKKHVGYDEHGGFVIRAKTEDEARYIASQAEYQDTKHLWHDSAETKCEPLSEVGEPGVILADFRAG